MPESYTAGYTVGNITFNDCNTTWTPSVWEWIPDNTTFKYYPDIKIGGYINEAINNKIEGVEIMKLYEVWTVYVEDQKKPIIAWQRLVARDQEEAKIKSGLLKEIDDTWDTDYLTVIVKEIGDVKVKEKPKEVKTIA